MFDQITPLVVELAASPLVYVILFALCLLDGFFPPVPSESALVAVAAIAATSGAARARGGARRRRPRCDRGGLDRVLDRPPDRVRPVGPVRSDHGSRRRSPSRNGRCSAGPPASS
ncbi:hypothetical protein Q9Q99_02900 [Curtobacterium flaccumfaciens]|nr:hypothetical protein Q9Q99_02900 [Curtobacterium flaccumfaciens]